MEVDQDKKFVLNEFLKTIAAISDKDFQERVWIRTCDQ